jgi:hypothetical protein
VHDLLQQTRLANVKRDAPPATLTKERHTDAFAQGDALVAAVKPLVR